jgi:type VI secretion system protein VasD
MPSSNDTDSATQAAHPCGTSALRSISPESVLSAPIRTWLLLTAFAALSACRGSKTPEPQASCRLPVTIDVRAGERLNPDEQSQPLPTLVRVFQLTHAVRVEEADFVQLWEQPEQTIGDHLVQKQELTVFPGSVEHVALELDPKTRFLVGMGVFRQPTGTQWRTLLPLPPSEKLCGAYEDKAPEPAVVLSLDDYRIESRSNLLRDAEQVDLPADITAGSERTKQQPDASHAAEGDPPPRSPGEM